MCGEGCGWEEGGFFMKNLVEGLPPPFEHVFDPPTGPRRPEKIADRQKLNYLLK